MKAEGGDSTQWRPKSNPWLIAATVALAAFMEVLDTSIANCFGLRLPYSCARTRETTGCGGSFLNCCCR
jgi:hypothetical protein